MGLPAQAHDMPGLLHDLDSPELPESVKSFYSAYRAEGDERTRAVLVNAFVWPLPSRLTVCFSGGPLEFRPLIAAAMREWQSLSGGNITFIFADRDDSAIPEPAGFKECDGVTRYKIRIGFVPGGGHWSQIGTLSETVFPRNSMNLDFDRMPRLDNQRMREVALHEFGHALGFHHEHQSPGSPCRNWAWDRILIAYQWPGTTREEKERAMHFNLDRLNDQVLITGQHAYTFTAYDRSSIMHYSFPADMFVDREANPCYIPQPQDLSPTDKEAMKDVYARPRVAGVKTRGIDELLSEPRFGNFHDLLNQQKQLYPNQ